MYFYTNRVAETHLNKYANKLLKRWDACETEKVTGVSKDLEIHKTEETKTSERIYFIVDKANKTVPGYCCLDVIPGWTALETNMLFVNPSYRGLGIALIIYDGILKDGNIVISGWSHNPKSKGVWYKLATNKKYTAWAHDIKNLDRYCQLDAEDNQLKCDLKLYENIRNKKSKQQKEDIRIIIYNKRYLNVQHPVR